MWRDGVLAAALLMAGSGRPQVTAASSFEVSPQAIADYYRTHTASFVADEAKVRLLQIVVGPSEDAKGKLDRMMARLQSGEDFRALPSTPSEAPMDLGYVPVRMLDLLGLYASVRQMQPGDVSPIRESGGGFRLLKLVEAVQAGERKLNDPDVQAAIRARLIEEFAPQLSVAGRAGGTTVTRAGFALTVPAGWRVEESVQKRPFSPLNLLDRIAGIDYQRIIVMMADPGVPEVNINVVVSPQPWQELTPGEILSTLSPVLRGVGATPVLATQARLAGEDSILVVAENSDAQGSRVRQWQAAFRGRNGMYIVTCSAPAGSFHSQAPVFAAALNSFDGDQGWRGLPHWLIRFLTGGLAGGLISLVYPVWRRRFSG